MNKNQNALIPETQKPGFVSSKLYQYVDTLERGSRKQVLLLMAAEHLQLLEEEVIQNIKSKAAQPQKHPPLVKNIIKFLGAIIIGSMAIRELTDDYMKRNDLNL